MGWGIPKRWQWEDVSLAAPILLLRVTLLQPWFCAQHVLCILLCASHHTMQQEQTLAGTPWLRLETYTLGIAVFTIHNKLSVMMHDSLIR